MKGDFAELGKQDRANPRHYSPGPCCVGACAYSRPALEPERDKTGIPATADGTSGEGSNNYTDCPNHIRTVGKYVYYRA